MSRKTSLAVMWAADLWTIFGPLGVSVLFLVVSLSLVEAWVVERRTDNLEVQTEVSKLVPRFRRRN